VDSENAWALAAVNSVFKSSTCLIQPTSINGQLRGFGCGLSISYFFGESNREDFIS
jgi:hypothetical protein